MSVLTVQFETRLNVTNVSDRKVKMYNKKLICVQRLCRIEIVPDYTGDGSGRFHCIIGIESDDKSRKLCVCSRTG